MTEALGLSQLWIEIRNGVPAAMLGMKHVKMGTLVIDSNFSVKGSFEVEEAAKIDPAGVSD